MKLSVSLSEDEVEFLDAYMAKYGLESRSAVFQTAIRLVRDLDLAREYEQAFSDEERYEDPEILEKWHRMHVEFQEAKGKTTSAAR